MVNPPENKQTQKAGSSDSNGSQNKAPAITLPKGGGAIRGMGEKFAANPVTGTGSMSVPIATSPGRSGFGPQLSLSYDSGSGNGPYGFGWSLPVPSITRKTDKGLPQYEDMTESDVFILSGAEDLVPVLNPDGSRFEDTTSAPGYQIHRYRPRIEGLFARIERWTRVADGDVHWRSISKDNILTLYGKDASSRIVDPEDPRRIFSWLICETRDDKGNAVLYDYKAEDGDGIDLAQAHERNRGERNDPRRTANRYLKSIRYGNQLPLLDNAGQRPSFLTPQQLQDAGWLFEVVFDYGEGHFVEEAPDAQGRIFARAQIDPPAGSGWPVRQDPFSNYRATFEVRTYRLCRRVLMFHHFSKELGIQDYLVRSTEFSYSEGPIASFITAVTQSGYVRQPTQAQANRYLKKSLPPLEFDYSQVPSPDVLVQQPIREMDADSLANLPAGLDGGSYQWVDLDSEGTSGILTEQADGWYYKRNLSANNQVREDGQEHTLARFGPIERVARKPDTSLTGGAQFLDLAGDGQVDLVQMEGPVRGFYERTDDAGWISFQPFISWPDLDTRDPELRFVDLNGDGHADILISEGEGLIWYPSLAEEGFGPAIRLSLPLDEEKGPRLIFADGVQSIYLADLSGDGLNDLARILNGEVCYWPNLGYGHFGAKVTMDNAPRFDSLDQFDQRRIRLADTDGSGTTDILYLRGDGVQIYFNQCGNGWSDAVALPQFPPIDNISSVQALDLLGNGTACLVWSSPLPGATRQPMRYIALMEEKPHLLVGVRNNLGAETRVHYAPSTKFYLADEAAGKPWITRLPFPVHVVDQVEIIDHVSRNRFVTRSTYHHGYFDGVEREFRGFGMVDQLDTEQFATLSQSGTLPDATNIEESSHVPPVLTRTWFHTGAFANGDRISKYYEHEYYREGDPSLGEGELSEQQLEAMLLPDTVLPSDLAAEEGREACRSLKGSILRQEIYALDEKEESDRPYSVSERNYTINRLQALGSNRHAVFFTHARETIDFHYERKLYDIAGQKRADPRVTHNAILEVDEYGNVLKAVAIGYGRRRDDPDPILTAADRQKQKATLLTFTENRYSNAVQETGTYRTPLLCEARTYELTRVLPNANQPGITNLFRFQELVDKVAAASDGQHDLPYEDLSGTGATEDHPYRRLIEQVRMLFHSNDLDAALPLGQMQALALPYESYKLAFTPGLLAQVFQRQSQALLPDPAKVLGGQGAEGGGYVDLDGDDHWWIPSGRAFLSPNNNDTAAQELAYARQHFFLPHRYRDPFHMDTFTTETVVSFDDHNLLIHETQDALGNSVIAENDYRVLRPDLITDPNGNRAAAAFDALGMVAGTAVMGKVTEHLGDNLNEFEADLLQNDMDDFHDAPDPHTLAPTLLKEASTRVIYDLHRFYRSQKIQPDDPTLWEAPYAATLARETHAADPLPSQGLKIQISFSYSDGFGREIQKKVQAEPGKVEVEDVEGNVTVVDTTPNLRWVGSGWTIYNNKGKPVRQYEPFFSNNHQFQFGKKVGVSLVLFYDPVERVVATLHPNHTWEKVVFDAWQGTTYDVNDTVTFDPKTDSDVNDFFTRLPDSDYLPTWYAQRIGLPANDPERIAADKASAHADTPTTAYFDSLGRPFLTVVHNKVVCPDHDLDGTDDKFHARVELDIEGNQREVHDERRLPVNGLPTGELEQRIVMRYDYDMLGDSIHQASMEAGERWMLNDITGKPIRAWDSRGQMFRTAYDQLHRPVDSYLNQGTPQDMKIGRSIYGDSQSNAEANNLRGKVIKLFDQAGVVTSDMYDFKGNLLHNQRQLAQEYKTTLNWDAGVDLESETFTSHTHYDALNRPIQMIALHSDSPSAKVNVIQPSYNEANLLEQVNAWLNQAAEPSELLDKASADLPAVKNIDYDAKGQRLLIEYGNGAVTTYDYDSQTFRLTHLKTTRPAGLNGLASQLFSNAIVVQDLHYTYDPAGNITNIEDGAVRTTFHNNQQVDPSCNYTYDAIYRLIEATAREHIGQARFDFAPPNHNYRDYPFVGNRPGANDPDALRNYAELYVYDEVGNFGSWQHKTNGGGWTQTYVYDEESLTEAGKKSNRLTRTTIGNGLTHIAQYTYDAHGNMTSIPHLSHMDWDYQDQFQRANLGGGGDAYYVYDASGQRARKVIERQNGTRQKERLYLGGFELYREYNGSGESVALERETLHVMDDQQRIALVETRTQGKDGSPGQLIRYQFGNHLGSVSLELDDQGQIISYGEYYPYGSAAYQAVRSQTETPKRYRYTGKERDEESGLNYHALRYYGPWLGRWVNVDPHGLKGGSNLYSYAHANPTMYSDTNGATPDKYDTFDEFLPGLITDYPRLGQAWNSAAETVLQSRYGKGSIEANKKAFRAELDTLPKGPKQTELAREVFNSVRSGFYRRVGKLYKKGIKVLGGIDLPEDVIKKMIKGGTRPASGVQIDHAIDELAEHPYSALDPINLGLRKGHARVPGGSHYEATEGRKRLRESRQVADTESVNSSQTIRELQMQALQGFHETDKSDPYAKETDDMYQWGWNILNGTVEGGPIGASKEILNPVQLGKATVIFMGSPHMFGARGGLEALIENPYTQRRKLMAKQARRRRLKAQQAEALRKFAHFVGPIILYATRKVLALNKNAFPFW